MSQDELRGVVVLTRVIDTSNSEIEFVRVGTIDECQQWYTFQWEQIIKLHPDLNVLPYVDKSQFYRMAQFNRAGGEALFMLHEYHERHFLYAKYIEAAGAQQSAAAEAADDLSELEQALNANAALQARVEQLEALLQEAAQVIAPIKDAVEYDNDLKRANDNAVICIDMDCVHIEVLIADYQRYLQVKHLRAVAAFAAKLAALPTPQPDNYELVMCSQCGKWNTDCHCEE